MTPKQTPITHHGRPPLPEEKLWKKVLSEGLKDKAWRGTNEFAVVCLLAGADPGNIRRRVVG